MNIRPECLDDDPADETCLTKPDMYIDPCVEEEYQDASFCTGDSDQGYGEPMCEITERSARGYCPGEEGHEAERLSVICSDPTNHSEECYDWRLEEYGDGYWGTNEGEYESLVEMQEVMIQQESAPVGSETLPDAGAGILLVVLLTILAFATGTKALLTK